MMGRIAQDAPRLTARIAGFVYLLVFVTGVFALLNRTTRLGAVAGLTAGVLYIVVTLLFYYIFKPVDRNLSLLAALFSMAGIVVGALTPLHIVPSYINNLAFFGVYCLLIGYLIFRSTFLPRVLAALMAFGGLGWLTFLSPSLASSLQPYNFFPGILGEGILTLWLLVLGVNEPRWKQQAGAAADRPSRGDARV